jgi:TetR/AcrR family transcriptional regulator, transcriptional repressor for nem operon
MGRKSTARERILNSAKDLFHSRSTASVGIAEICVEAGVKKGSLYHFFPSKEHIVLAVIDAQLDAMKAEEFEPAFKNDIPPLARFQRFFVASMERMQSDACCYAGCPIGNLIAELGSQDPKIRERLSACLDEIQAIFERTLLEAVEVGELPKATNPVALAGTLLALIQGIAIVAKATDDPVRVATIGAQALQLLGLGSAVPKKTRGPG